MTENYGYFEENLNSFLEFKLDGVNLEPLKNTLDNSSTSECTLPIKKEKKLRKVSQKRRIANRESARRSRAKKKEELEFFKNAFDILKYENSVLKKDLCELFAIQQMALETIDSETRDRLTKEFCVAKFCKKVQQFDAQSRQDFK
jgi:hypothetical protein